jgi:hypothetical protein
MRSRKALVAAVIAVFALVGGALAFWTTGGSGTAAASVGTMSPASVSASAGSAAGSIKLTFSAQALLNGASNSSIAYTVYRSADGTTYAPVPSSSGCYGISYGATTCTDGGLTGTFRYYVLAHFGSSSTGGWTAQSAVAGPVSVIADSTAPVTTATTSPAPNAAGWNNTSPVSVTLSSDDNGGSGVKEIRYTTDGSAPTSSSTLYSGPFNVSSTATVRYFATDNAGNAETAKPLTVSIDTAAPTGGSITANASTSASYNASGSVSLTKVNFTDANSGLAAGANAITRASSSLNGDSCVTPTGSTPVTVDGSGNDSATLATGCYSYKLAAGDVAGNNTSAVSAVVKVDRTAPTTPSLTLGNATGPATFVSGTTVYLNAQAGKSGTFDVSATSTDPDTGIAKLTFPALAGFTSGGGDDTSSPYATTYAWSGAVAASGAQTVAATNLAGGSATSQFTVTPDTAGPTVPAPTVTSGYYTSASVPVTVNAPTDAGSGVKASTVTLERQQGSLANDVCDFTTGSPAYTTVTLVGGSDTSVTTGHCYRYREQASDNIGNAGTPTVSNVAKVDTTAPTGTLTAPAAGTTGGNVSLTSTTAADTGGSGLASVTFQEAPNGSTTYSDIATDTSSPYSAIWDTTTVANGAYNLRAVITDLAGNSTTTATVAVTLNNSFTLLVPSGTKNAGSPIAVTVTAVGSTTTNTAYSGAHTVTFSGPSSAPDGTAPSYPSAALTFTNGVATANVTLYKAETTTLMGTSGFVSGASSSFTVSDGGSPGGLVFTHSTITPLSCATTIFECSLTVIKGASWSSSVSLTDAWGNLGPKMTGQSTTTVSVTHTNAANGLTPASLQITKNTGTPSGTETGGAFTFTASTANGNNNDTVTASAPGLKPAVALITVH